MKNMSALCREFWENGKSGDCPVYDMHGHMGEYGKIYLPYPQPEEMVARMQRAGVELLVFSHHSALGSPDTGNRLTLEAARKFPDKLKGYCVYNPNYPEIGKADIHNYEYNRDAFVGFKLHPGSHGKTLTDDAYRPVLDFANREELPVLVHTWGGDAEAVRVTLQRYGGAKFLLGHSIHGQWREAAECARDNDNVYLELCAVPDERAGILELFVNVAGSAKILFGTDFPWFSHHYYIGALLAADISDDDRRNILYRNAQKLLGIRAGTPVANNANQAN